MGKAFSHTSNRNVGDYYPTPYSMTEQLLDVERFDGLKNVYIFTRMPNLNAKLRKDGKLAILESY